MVFISIYAGSQKYFKQILCHLLESSFEKFQPHIRVSVATFLSDQNSTP